MLTAKQEAFKNAKVAGEKDIDAARIAYPNIKTDAALSTIAYKMVRHGEIKAAIDAHRAENQEKAEITRELLVNKMYDIVGDEHSTRTEKTRAASLIADMCGFKREAAPNKEKEQALAARMTKEEKALALLAAKLRTEQEARAGLKLA